LEGSVPEYPVSPPKSRILWNKPNWHAEKTLETPKKEPVKFPHNRHLAYTKIYTIYTSPISRGDLEK
jgi:hypothetical protein